jgi:hypothetical protein
MTLGRVAQETTNDLAAPEMTLICGYSASHTFPDDQMKASVHDGKARIDGVPVITFYVVGLVDQAKTLCDDNCETLYSHANPCL